MIAIVLFITGHIMITLVFAYALCEAASSADEKMNELFSERED